MLETITGILAALAVLGMLAYVIGVYNSQVALSRTIAQQFSNIEVVLKQRHDELPKLVDTCRAYMAHERDTLEAVISLRSDWRDATPVAEKVRGENALNQAVVRLYSRIENYPDLKASAQFENIAQRISGLESTIRDRRELFNQAVTHYNVFIGQFPVVLLAALWNWRRHPLLEFEGAELADVPIRMGG